MSPAELRVGSGGLLPTRCPSWGGLASWVSPTSPATSSTVAGLGLHLGTRRPSWESQLCPVPQGRPEQGPSHLGALSL